MKHRDSNEVNGSRMSQCLSRAHLWTLEATWRKPVVPFRASGMSLLCIRGGRGAMVANCGKRRYTGNHSQSALPDQLCCAVKM